MLGTRGPMWANKSLKRLKWYCCKNFVCRLDYSSPDANQIVWVKILHHSVILMLYKSKFSWIETGNKYIANKGFSNQINSEYSAKCDGKGKKFLEIFPKPTSMKVRFDQPLIAKMLLYVLLADTALARTPTTTWNRLKRVKKFFWGIEARKYGSYPLVSR